VLGIFVPALVFGDYKPDLLDPANLQEGRDLALKVMVVEAVMGYCLYLLNIFFQEALPPTPPSASVSAPRDPFKSALKKLLSNKDYLFLLLSFGCYFGIFNGLSVVLSFLIEPWFGGDELPIAVGAVGGFPIVTGIIGVVVLGPMQRKSGVFKKWVLICMMGKQGIT
jgi:MFS transporter, FLVCR family, feline leukemia virus subgroup C receptor-related protein